MEDVNKVPLVSSEIVGIWNSYMNDSMGFCVIKHFLNNVKDIDVRPIIEYALKLSNEHLPVLANFFNQEGLPVPDGFREDKDLNLNALCNRFYHSTFLAKIDDVSHCWVGFDGTH